MAPTDKLLKLLYQTSAPQTAGRVSVAMNAIKHKKPHDFSSFLSLENDAFARKPWADALTDITTKMPSPIRSNILKFNTFDSLIRNTDLYNVYPRKNDRVYALPEDLENGIHFTAVKARHPASLSFANGYYLVFPSYLQAAVYYLEAGSKSINGVPLNLKFLQLSRKTLSQLGLETNKITGFTSPTTTSSLSLDEIIGLDVDENYKHLTDFIDFPSRKSTVLVKNLPLGLSSISLSKLLWDYEFPSDLDPTQYFKQIASDALKQVHVMTIKFADENNAARFIRSFNGTRWHGSTRDVTNLHEPILCETLE